jgi:hypothetical protein
VPAEFLSYLVFHEALHSVVPPVSLGHRREEHSATFRAIERGYPGWASMRRMESVLLQALLG